MKRICVDVFVALCVVIFAIIAMVQEANITDLVESNRALIKEVKSLSAGLSLWTDQGWYTAVGPCDEEREHIGWRIIGVEEEEVK